ncbi:hypothetical protein C0033_16000 [Clostridium sp. chh4-2]|uniref:AraC family transcriptional regulator n=1 Tax=Clostridium sp. chh4-2 TaxID=2067550 RepID=UPI000CCF52BA|nr:helix-turn-helix domain-containing protein [Clostridium sp. chh4-2]PNV60948.1 hypothetical protein C0033_16000 [Clostridium sp. chh4-2]
MKQKKGSYFIRVFITLLAVILVPLSAFTVISRRIFVWNMNQEIGKTNLEMLEQSKKVIDRSLTDVQNLSDMLISDPSVIEFVNRKVDLSVYKSAETINRITNTIYVVKEGNSYLKEIYIYSRNNDLLLSQENGILHKLSKDQQDKLEKRYEAGEREFFVITDDGSGQKEIRMVRLLERSIGQFSGAVIIDLDLTEFLHSIEQVCLRKTGYLLVFGPDDTLITSSRKDLYKIAQADERPWMEQAFGSYNCVFNKEKLLLSSVVSENFGWRYMSVIPVSEIDYSIKNITNTLLMVFAVIISSMVFVTYLLAREMNTPIQMIRDLLLGEKKAGESYRQGRIYGETPDVRAVQAAVQDMVGKMDIHKSVVSENEVLKSIVEDNRQRLKNYFLIRLVNQDITDPAEIRQTAENYNIPTDDYFAVISISFAKGYAKATCCMDKEEKRDLKLDILAHVKLLFKDECFQEAFYEESKQILLLIGLNEKEYNGDRERSIKGKCEIIQDFIKESYHFPPTILIGEYYKGLENIYRSYHDVNNARKYSYVLGADSMILSSELKRLTEDYHTPEYPYQTFLKNNLMAGNYQNVKQVIVELREYLRNDVVFAVQYGYFYKDMISILIGYVTQENMQNIANELAYALVNFEKVFEDLDEIVDYLYEIIDKIQKEHLCAKRIDPNIERVIDIIHSEYEKPLSLDEMSQRLDLTSSYISRLFKKETGQNFKDYLTRFRMMKAKELLLKSNYNINEIALKTGYLNGDQFGRAFKQLEGMTPYEYRKKVKE